VVLVAKVSTQNDSFEFESDFGKLAHASFFKGLGLLPGLFYRYAVPFLKAPLPNPLVSY
jgi:hypothetical protein